MHFDYHKKTWEKLEEAKKSGFFSTDNLSDESILARYYLSRYIYDTYSIVPSLKKNEWWTPIPIILWDQEKYYWSISHSNEFIAWMLSKSPCGIDIAEYEERDHSLFWKNTQNEYELLWGKTWSNFYVLWTAKEAIIKKLSRTLDDMENIMLISRNNEELTFVFSSQSHTISTIQEDNIFISYTTSYESI